MYLSTAQSGLVFGLQLSRAEELLESGHARGRGVEDVHVLEDPPVHGIQGVVGAPVLGEEVNAENVCPLTWCT